MATPYKISNNNDRYVNGDTKGHRAPQPPPVDIALHRGDITARRDSDKRPIPVSELGAAFASALLARQAAHDFFWGINQVALPDEDLGQRPTLSRAGVYKYPLEAPANNIEDGDFIGVSAVDIGGGNFQCQNQAVIKVATLEESIGRARTLVGAGGDNITEVEVEIVSSISDGGVQALVT